MPGLAFDRQGNRLGYGKGCYDKLLKNLTAVRIGICFEAQLVESVPSNKNDQKMDFVITAKGIVKCAK